MAIQKREHLIKKPKEEIPLVEENETPSSLHFSYKQNYPEYKRTYQAVKRKMERMLQKAWETGDLMIRMSDEDNDKFFETLDNIKAKVPDLFEKYVTLNFSPLVQKWLVDGLEDEEFGILSIACYKLIDEDDAENKYGKLGKKAFRMEAEYSTEIYPVD
jgi:hypothetical protein